MGLKLYSAYNLLGLTMHWYVCTCEGGYDLLGRTKDQIRTTEQVNAALTTCQTLKLDALVIIGGKDAAIW